jgi:cytoplasmic iron level regulating protein YaaA (DUF328/UPF0246 family)
MIITLSPSKGQDFENAALTSTHSVPDQLKDSQVLVNIVKKRKPAWIKKLMGVSDALAELNYERYQSYSTPFTPQNAKQALFAFTGDVYSGLNLNTMSEEDFNYAQGHLRILSGLYGCLKPLDLIQPYRLEMKTKLKSSRGDNLYQFWKSRITNKLNESLEKSDSSLVVNLASSEYWKSVQPKNLNAEVINVSFKEEKDGQSRIIAIFAKKARGMMADFIIRNRIESLHGLKDFNYEGYKFNESESQSHHLVFSRPQPDPVSAK